jgi:hypothetical protein
MSSVVKAETCADVKDAICAVDKPPKLLGMRIPYVSNWVKTLGGKNRLTNIRRIYFFENTNQNLAQKTKHTTKVLY